MRPRKIWLIKLIKSMFLFLGLAFAFVLFRSLSGPALTTSVNSPFDDVELGETAMRRLLGQRVWATRLTPLLRRQLKELESSIDSSSQGCLAEQVLCVVAAQTDRSGIEIRYTRERPPQLHHSVPWLGGFVNPTTGAVFDLLGRPYTQGEALTIIEADRY